MPRSGVITGVVIPTLALCVMAGIFIPLAVTLQTVGAAQVSSRPQHPPQVGYPSWAITCPSVTTCVVVGNQGRTLVTRDGGRHWNQRPSKTSSNLYSVVCPSPAVCYTAGSTLNPR